jgi:hypothetical protein
VLVQLGLQARSRGQIRAERGLVKMSIPTGLARRGRRSPSLGIRWLIVLGALAAGALGCNAGGEPIEVAGSSSLGGASTDGPSAGGSRATSPDEPAPIFEDPPTNAPPTKCDKVDFLYVVDNSASMADKQEILARSFDGFSEIVTETLGTNDHHIMVIDTDSRNINDGLTGLDDLDACVGILGAGLRNGAEGESCGIEGPQRYMLDRQSNPEDTFSCLAKVGIFGDADESPVDALLAATGAVASEIGDCNDGFLRDDAVLVVTIITDEEDEVTPGTPAQWKRELLRAKDDREEAIVVLGLLSDIDVAGGLPGGPCDEASGGAAAPLLQSFVSSFERGSMGSVCASDYSAFFAQAVSVIDTACRELAVPR